MMLSSAMNGFYGLKRLTGNAPADDGQRILHPGREATPLRLAISA